MSLQQVTNNELMINAIHALEPLFKVLYEENTFLESVEIRLGEIVPIAWALEHDIKCWLGGLASSDFAPQSIKYATRFTELTSVSKVLLHELETRLTGAARNASSQPKVALRDQNIQHLAYCFDALSHRGLRVKGESCNLEVTHAWKALKIMKVPGQTPTTRIVPHSASVERINSAQKFVHRKNDFG